MSVNPGIEFVDGTSTDPSTETVERTVTHIEAWELTLPEDEAACDAVSGCSRAAEWAGILRPCGHLGGTLCTPHKEMDDEIVAGTLGTWHCDACRADILDVTWNRI